MPWSETCTMDLRIQFIRDWLTRRHTVVDLCARYCVSRKTGYKWIDRYLQFGPDGLLERTHAAKRVHNKTAPEAVEALLALRLKHPSWGAKKLLHQLALRQPELELPGRTTVCDILSRSGLVAKRPHRRTVGHPGRPSSPIALPNDCWSADFKGHFRTGDGIYCYPLTVTDNFSRYLLGCQGLHATTHDDSKAVFTRLFKEYGLPRRMRTDNGVPFAASSALARLSRLSVWWIKLGVMPELIEPGKPQQNGRHERMHRTLKAETLKPPAANARAQQRRFDAFQLEFNNERPHEALDMRTPSQLYQPSNRPMPNKPQAMEYPDRFEVRYVSANGGVRWHGHWLNVTSSLVDEHVGFEEVDDGQWDVYFGPVKLGRFHERLMCIEDHLGQLKRRSTPDAEP
jgi:putative transposase